jgi:NADPH-dependent curcumin reductase CurA
MRPILVNRATVRGFIVSDHADRSGEFLREAAGWVQAGRLRYREDIVEGLENAPRAFIGLLRGENFGKRLIRVGADPTRQ